MKKTESGWNNVQDKAYMKQNIYSPPGEDATLGVEKAGEEEIFIDLCVSEEKS